MASNESTTQLSHTPTPTLPTQAQFLEDLDSLRVPLHEVLDDDQQLGCGICRDHKYSYDRAGCEVPLRLHGRHIFGHKCIRRWLETSDQCPGCRQPLYELPEADILLDAVEDALGSDTASEIEITVGEEHDDRDIVRPLRAYVREQHTNRGSEWWLSRGSWDARSLLQLRAHLYGVNLIDVHREDYADYHRTTPGLWQGLSSSRRTLNSRHLIRQLRQRYWTIVDNSMMQPRDRPISVAMHPIAWVALHTICNALREWSKPRASAVELEDELHRRFRCEAALGNLRRRSMDGDDLPKGMYGYVLDVIEQMLMDFMGSAASKARVQGVRKKAGQKLRPRRTLY